MQQGVRVRARELIKLYARFRLLWRRQSSDIQGNHSYRIIQVLLKQKTAAFVFPCGELPVESRRNETGFRSIRRTSRRGREIVSSFGSGRH